MLQTLLPTSYLATVVMSASDADVVMQTPKLLCIHEPPFSLNDERLLMRTIVF